MATYVKAKGQAKQRSERTGKRYAITRLRNGQYGHALESYYRDLNKPILLEVVDPSGNWYKVSILP